MPNVDSCMPSTRAALELDNGYVKALLRRAQAYETLTKLEDALDGV